MKWSGAEPGQGVNSAPLPFFTVGQKGPEKCGAGIGKKNCPTSVLAAFFPIPGAPSAPLRLPHFEMPEGAP